MNRSKKYRLNRRDIIKGLLLSIIVAALTTLQGLLTTPNDWLYIAEQVARAAIAAGIGYILKNFFEDENGSL